jgi:glycosyltransferase involved in cell wall biosynthesis
MQDSLSGLAMPEPDLRTAISHESISLVLLACNASAHVEALLGEWSDILDGLKRPCEIILVDDGSTDATPAMADALASRFPQLRVLHHASRMGMGAALRSGIAAARYPLLAYTTCDRQYQPGDLQRLLEAIDKVDLVIGYRLWLQTPPLLRRLGSIYRGAVRVLFGIPLDPLPSWLGHGGQKKRWLARWLFGVRVHDVECAFRLCRRSIFEHLPIQSHGPFAQVELLAKANFLGCWITQVPVAFNPAESPLLDDAPNPIDSYLAEALRLMREPTFRHPEPPVPEEPKVLDLPAPMDGV